jgi:non-lysosomal glucosylceramidase
VVCSWPNGGRPTIPLSYGDEVWTGIEYQVAAHLVYNGLIDEGLQIVKGISGRYDGVRRNPWNQIEWGNHYARAMASYSVMLAMSGFRYSAVEREIVFQPRMHPEDFRCFFAAGSAWGSYSQQLNNGSLKATVDCRYGEMKLRHVLLGGEQTKTTFSTASVVAPDGRKVECSLAPSKRGIRIDLNDDVSIGAGQSLTATLAGSGKAA